MKKNLIVVMFLIIVNMMPVNVFAQQTYYWYFNQKINVSFDYSHWTIKGIDKKIVEGNSVLKLRNSRERKEVRQLSNGYYKVSFSSPITISDIATDFVESAIPSLVIKEKTSPLFMNGNIIVMPNEKIDIEAITKTYGLKLLNKLNYGAYLFQVLNHMKTLDAANRLHESGLVKWSTPDFYAEMQANSDPLYNAQYYLTQDNNIDINAPEAWYLTKGSINIRVAVLDQGIDAHEDLSGNLLAGFTPGSNNTNGSPINSNEVHGIACAGIIAANHDNGLGIKGVAPNSKIIPVKILGDGSYGYSSSEVATAITWSYQANGGNADILSNSWGFTAQGFYDASIAKAINDARTLGRAGKGAIVVFASGNSNNYWSGVTFPANLNGVITVGAINSTGAIWGYSSRGPQMDLVCPSGGTDYSGDVTTLDRMGALGLNSGNYMGVFGGTSAACPQVSGVAALILSINPNLTEPQVTNVLNSTATDMGIAGFDDTFGYGRLNACAAVYKALGTTLSISGAYEICGSETYTIPNLPVGSVVNWSVAPAGVLSFTTSGNTATFTKIGNAENAVITANITTPCGQVAISKDVNPGNYLVIYDRGAICPNTGGNIFSSNQTLTGNYLWKLRRMDGSTPSHMMLGERSQRIDLIVYETGTFMLSFSSTTSCGVSQTQIPVTVLSSGCSGGFFPYAVYPNPSSRELKITQKAVENVDLYHSKKMIANSFTVKLLNEKGKVLKEGKASSSSKEIVLQVADIPNGIYYLHIYEGKNVSKQQVVISH